MDLYSHMDAETSQNTRCPVGETSCAWLQQLAGLQQRVDELSRLVSHDPLTGLFNYRHFSETLPTVLERTRRSLRPSCLIMVDLDHFKVINDTWGHEVGNIALRQAACLLREQVRKVDVICRYGGEEFIVILPDTNLRQAVDVAQRIRHAIEQTPVVFPAGEFSFTASMGVDVYRAQDSVSAETFIDAVDGFLYQAKQAGRNRVCHRDFEDIESNTSVSHEERTALSALFRED